MNSTICSTATLIGIHVVVGGWNSHVFAIQNTKAAISRALRIMMMDKGKQK